jgi:glutamyl-tRNA reductase
MGINAKSSELDLRERLAKAAQKLFGSEASTKWAENSLLLSTCHRTEIYFTGEDLIQMHREFLSLLRTEIDDSFEQNLYSYFGGDCFLHLAMVVSGLDSVIIGETEIQRQIKRSYENALLYRSLRSPLHFLFQKSFKIAKELRSASFFPRGHLSLEGSIFQLYKQMLDRTGPVLFIGNSAINRKIIRFFRKKGIEHLALCTRGVHSALELAGEGKLELVEWGAISSWKEYPLVVCGTNQAEYLIKENELTEQVETRLIIDLCVPRNVDPRLAYHSKITLLNIEEIGRLLQAKAGKHDEEVRLCREQVSLLVARQLMLFEQKEEKLCFV